MIALENLWFVQKSLDCLGQKEDVRRRYREEEESTKLRPKESPHGCTWELVAFYSTLQVFIPISGIILTFAEVAETIPGLSGNQNVSNGVETDGQLKERHIVVTRSLVPLAGGLSKMSLSLTTVEVGAGSCWSRRLMMVIFVFKLRIY